MALYGKAAGLDMGTIAISAVSGKTITFASTIAAYGVEPGDTLVLDRAGTPEYVKVKSVDSTTKVTLWNTPSTAAAGDHYAELLEAPKYVHQNDEGNILGASPTEADAGITGLSHAGWVKKHVKSRSDGTTSTWYETLVASSSLTDDVAGTDF